MNDDPQQFPDFTMPHGDMKFRLRLGRIILIGTACILGLFAVLTIAFISYARSVGAW